MGKMSRDKGARVEREIVNALRAAGLADCERVPLSGACHGSFGGDIQLSVMGEVSRFEAKARADGFRQIYDWLGEHTGLFIKRDRSAPLVVIRLADFARLIKASRP